MNERCRVCTFVERKFRAGASAGSVRTVELRDQKHQGSAGESEQTESGSNTRTSEQRTVASKRSEKTAGPGRRREENRPLEQATTFSVIWVKALHETFMASC
jgi:hypothetical protein